MPLEDDYDECDWTEFAATHLAESYSGDRWHPELADEFQAWMPAQQETLAVAISVAGLKGLRRWWDARTEILGFRTPQECLADPSLHQRLRECLMRGSHW